MNPILPVSAVGQPTIEALQAQMSRYSQLASVLSAQASTDYNALKTAIKSGNIPDALSAFVQLQHDSDAAGSASSAPRNGEQPSKPDSLNATA